MDGTTPVFQFVAGNVALDFANTVAYRLDADLRVDRMQSERDMYRWVDQADLGCREALAELRPMTEHCFQRIIEARESVFSVFSAIALVKRIPGAAVHHIDAELHACQNKRRLIVVKHTGSWVWRDDSNYADVLLHTILSEAAQLLTSGPLNLVRLCADDSCGWLFVDLSNGRRRRWCRMADCGNRNKARTFYDRQRSRP